MVTKFEKLGLADVRRRIEMMLTLDFIIVNTYRHYNNFELIRNAKTLEWLSIAPIFDSGKDIDINLLSLKLLYKLFGNHQDMQIKFVKNYTWLNLATLDRKEEVKQSMITFYGMIKEKVVRSEKVHVIIDIVEVTKQQMNMKNKLYIAYGSNLNLKQMAVRCPTAKPIGIAMLRGYQLTFRKVATLEPDPKAETPVGIWEITHNDEISLDHYEGFPRLYRKEMVEVEFEGQKIKAMLYLMNYGLARLPEDEYMDRIKKGYKDMGLDTIYLTKALEHTKQRMSMNDKVGAEKTK